MPPILISVNDVQRAISLRYIGARDEAAHIPALPETARIQRSCASPQCRHAIDDGRRGRNPGASIEHNELRRVDSCIESRNVELQERLDLVPANPRRQRWKRREFA